MSAHVIKQFRDPCDPINAALSALSSAFSTAQLDFLQGFAGGEAASGQAEAAGQLLTPEICSPPDRSFGRGSGLLPRDTLLRMIGEVSAALGALRRSADAGVLQLDGAVPASEVACRARETDLVPYVGVLTWTLPPSYRAFLAEHNRLSCRREVHDLRRAFVVVDDEEIVALNADLVHLPEHVSRDPGRYLSTNHLVGFAEAGHEAVWCFDISRPGIDGEYPVYYHHQDEPRVRYVDGGAGEDPADDEPDFASDRVHQLEQRVRPTPETPAPTPHATLA